MRTAWTTRCCAVALALSATTVFAQTQSRAPSAPPRLFPAQQSWTLALNNELTAPPAMAGKFGYFPLAGDRLAAYDVEYGTLLWLVTARPLSQPAVGNDLVFIVEPDAITALRQQTGSLAWRLPFNEPMRVPLTWNGGWLVGATTSGSVLAFRGNDGGLIWRRDIEGGVSARPVIAGDRVYVPATQGQIISLRVENGEVLWTRRIGGVPNDILPLESRLYVGSTDNYLYAIDATSGAQAWRWPTGGDVIGAPVADDEKVYFVSYDNVLRALDRKSGAQRWKRPLPLRPTRGPVRAGDAVIVSGLSRNALAFWLKDGAPAGDLPANGELATQPYVLDGFSTPTLVIVTRDFAEGTVLRALKRSYEPAVAGIGVLPNPITMPKPLGAVDSATDKATPPAPGAPSGAPATVTPEGSSSAPRQLTPEQLERLKTHSKPPSR